jgi:carnitine O-acetyltransferase
MRNAQGGIFGGQNRWFDKCLTIIVENSGRAAVMGEHSPVDALIPSFVVDFALDVPVDNAAYASKPAAPKLGEGFKREDFEVNQATLDEITACGERNKRILADSDGSALWWGECGTDWIKKVAKQSPDAFIQQVLQLAWFRDQGFVTATYETASTRAFQHGRTDVIRSLSPESAEFVQAMENPEADDKKRYELLTKACSTHNTLTKESSNGNGYDRHLMGLKVQLRPGESHPLFDDELYAKSQEWKLSTSGLSSGIRFMATGFGAAWHDGYGINYMAGPNLIKFGLESKVSCPTTSTARFKHRLAQAFRDLRRVAEANAGEVKAKL